MRPQTPQHGVRRIRVRSPIAGVDADRRPFAVEPNVYVAEDAGDKVLLTPSEGIGSPLAVVPTPTFDGWLRRRDVVYLSW